MKKILLFLGVILTMPNCGSDSGKKQAGDEGKTAELSMMKSYFLEGDRAQISLPSQYKKSSKYRLTRDIRSKAHPEKVSELISRLFKSFEERDRQPDFIVDTLNRSDFIMIADVNQFTISKDSGDELKKDIANFHQFAYSINKNFKSESIESGLKRAGNKRLYKYKYKFSGIGKNDLFATFYILSTPDRNYFVIESSSAESDLEGSVISIK